MRKNTEWGEGVRGVEVGRPCCLKQGDQRRPLLKRAEVMGRALELWEEQSSRGSCKCKGPGVDVGLAYLENNRKQGGHMGRRAENVPLKKGWL